MTVTLAQVKGLGSTGVFAASAAAHIGVTFTPVCSRCRCFPDHVGGWNTRTAWTYGSRQRKHVQHSDNRNEAVSRAAVYGKYSIEDEARLPGMAAAIERDMMAAMVERIDRSIFVGDSGANEGTADIIGLSHASISEKTLTQSEQSQG